MKVRFDCNVPGYAVFFVRKDERTRLTPFFPPNGGYAIALGEMANQNFQDNPPVRPGEKKPPSPPKNRKQRSRRSYRHASTRSEITRTGGTGYDLSDQTFGVLSVVALAERLDPSGHRLWDCRCRCGKVVTTRGSVLLRGKRQSCGCMTQRERKLADIKAELDTVAFMVAIMRLPPLPELRI